MFRFRTVRTAEKALTGVRFAAQSRRSMHFAPMTAMRDLLAVSRDRKISGFVSAAFGTKGGKRTYLWRAVDDEGEVLEVLAQSHRNKSAALKLMRKLLKKQGYTPDEIVTDKLGSYSAALRELGLAHLHVTGGRLNNRAEVSHPLPGSGLFAKP
ncbi:MAG: putative transposase [Paracoccaceae bacterium]